MQVCAVHACAVASDWLHYALAATCRSFYSLRRGRSHELQVTTHTMLWRGRRDNAEFAGVENVEVEISGDVMHGKQSLE